jgi:homoserine kinase
MAIRRDAVRVSVPASSANLGPMFDCAGLALEIRDEYTAMASDDEGVRVEVEGHGADDVARDESHLIVRAMQVMFAALGERPESLALHCRNVIPHGRGLGSSAAAIVGGMVLARAMVSEGRERLTDADLLNVALEMESHPDNLSAALFGGCAIAWVDEDGRADCIALALHPQVQPLVFIPGSGLATSKAREMLDASVSRADAVFNIARAGLLVHALTVDPSYLHAATKDRLHQDARADAYPESVALLRQLRDAGVPAVISGAGPSVLALGAVPAGLITTSSGAGWAIQRPALAVHGAREIPIDPI